MCCRASRPAMELNGTVRLGFIHRQITWSCRTRFRIGDHPSISVQEKKCRGQEQINVPHPPLISEQFPVCTTRGVPIICVGTINPPSGKKHTPVDRIGHVVNSGGASAEPGLLISATRWFRTSRSRQTPARTAVAAAPPPLPLRSRARRRRGSAGLASPCPPPPAAAAAPAAAHAGRPRPSATTAAPSSRRSRRPRRRGRPATRSGSRRPAPCPWRSRNGRKVALVTSSARRFCCCCCCSNRDAWAACAFALVNQVVVRLDWIGWLRKEARPAEGMIIYYPREDKGGSKERKAMAGRIRLGFLASMGREDSRPRAEAERERREATTRVVMHARGRVEVTCKLQPPLQPRRAHVSFRRWSLRAAGGWRLPRCHAGLPLEIKPSQPPHGGWLRGATVTADGYVLPRIPSV
jgi:hypothetical protein